MINTYFRKKNENDAKIEIEYLISDELRKSGIIIYNKKTHNFLVDINASGCEELENKICILRIKDYYESNGEIPEKAVAIVVT